MRPRTTSAPATPKPPTRATASSPRPATRSCRSGVYPMRLGPWYGDGEESRRSCRHLRECVTEFGAQGLELDGVLLAWGTDLVWEDEAWSNARAKRHARSAHVREPSQLRVNAYRVLLTRGRDGAVTVSYTHPTLPTTK